MKLLAQSDLSLKERPFLKEVWPEALYLDAASSVLFVHLLGCKVCPPVSSSVFARVTPVSLLTLLEPKIKPSWKPSWALLTSVPVQCPPHIHAVFSGKISHHNLPGMPLTSQQESGLQNRPRHKPRRTRSCGLIALWLSLELQTRVHLL